MNPYEVLGVDKSASTEQIKKAYRKLSKEHHPDMATGDSEKFKEIGSAYEILSDPEKKQQFDTFGDTKNGGNPFAGGTPFGGGFEDLFNHFFRGGGDHFQQKRKGANESTVVNITLAEAMTGCIRKITYNKNVACDTCSGIGGEEATKCATCNGAGHVISVHNTPYGVQQRAMKCSACNDGYIIKNPCNTCKGSGVSRKTETINVNIPAGSIDHMHITKQGFGNAVKGGDAGDLLIRVDITPHPEFDREGNDLVSNIWISISEAVLGTEKTIKTPLSTIKFKIEPGCNSGKIYNFNGKGVPNLGNDGRIYGNGNLYIKVNVTIPKATEKTKHLFEELQKHNI